MTSYEKGVEQGRRLFIREMIEERLGPLRPDTVQRFEQVPAEQLSTLRKAIPNAESLRELGLDS